MNRFFATLGRFVVRYRWLIVLGWIAVVIVSARTLPSLGSEINNNNSQFLSASAPSNQAATLAIPLLGNVNRTSQVVVIASRADGSLRADDIRAIQAELLALKRVPSVISAKNLGTSSNGRASQIFVDAAISQSDVTAQETLITGIEHTFTTAHVPTGLSLHVAGAVAANVANQASSQRTGGNVQRFSILFIILLLFFIFRSVLAPILTLLPAAIALAVSNRFIGGLGSQGLQISEITELLLIVLLLGAGTDYGLFLVFRVREEITNGRDPRDAVAYSLLRVGESITASAGTVIFALLSLLLASFGIYHDLGIPLAVGIAVMLLAGLTLLPALLAIAGRAAFWPTRVHTGTNKVGLWGRVASRLLSHPARTLLLGIIGLAAIASAVFAYRSAGFGGAINAPAGSDAAIGNTLLAKYFPIASANPTNIVYRFSDPVWEHPGSLQLLQSELQASGKFGKIEGPLDPTGTVLTPTLYATLHRELGNPGALAPIASTTNDGISPSLYEAYRSTATFVSADGRTIQYEVALTAGDPGSTAALDAVPAIRSVVQHAGAIAGVSASGVAGEAPALYDVSATSNHDLFNIVPIAIIAIGILLGLVLRSAIAPLYLIVSVALSYFAALGLSVIVFIGILGWGGLTFILPFLMFLFLLALGEDYNILVMTRIREEVHARPLSEAVTYAVGRTGPTITSAGLVLAGTFTVLGFAGASGPGGDQIRAIGFGLAIGVLMDTFIVRTVLVPATVALLGRLNWWPSHLSRSSLPEVSNIAAEGRSSLARQP